MLHYVEFKERKNFRPVGDIGIQHYMKPTPDPPVLTAKEWDLERSGGTLIMRHRQSGATYTCPWNDVAMALEKEDASTAKAGAPAAASAARR